MKETMGSGRMNNGGGMEANTLAILDSNEKGTREANDDRIAYLEAVRVASLVPENGTPPTNKMYRAIFRILRSGKTLELIMASYELLIELDKRFPRVCTSYPPSTGSCELEVVDEAWLPFAFSVDVASSDRETSGRNSGALFDSFSFNQLIQDLTDTANETSSQLPNTKILGNMLIFKYLVHVLEEDFGPRNSVHKETMNWNLLRESLLNTLLASRRINCKFLMKDCLSTMCRLYRAHAVINSNEDSESSEGRPLKNNDNAAEIGLVDVQKTTCIAMKKLMIMIMELDASKKKANLEGFTTRADGVRIPLVEIIVDELTYNSGVMSTFLQVFDDPKWKLESILQYFSKYIAKPSVRTRKSNGSATEDSTLNGVLKCFSNSTSARGITKKMGADVIQLLLGHAFQAHLALEHKEGDSLTEICNSIVSAFSNLKTVNRKMEILPFGKEALFTAATILSAIS